MSAHGLAAVMPEGVMTSMWLADKAVVHQVHPVKIGADVTASVISNTLLWKGRPKPAITVVGEGLRLHSEARAKSGASHRVASGGCGEH
jgi:hypothetical protein